MTMIKICILKCINVFGVSANCLMEARSSEEETESGRELVFFRHIDLLSAYLQ